MYRRQLFHTFFKEKRKWMISQRNQVKIKWWVERMLAWYLTNMSTMKLCEAHYKRSREKKSQNESWSFWLKSLWHYELFKSSKITKSCNVISHWKKIFMTTNIDHQFEKKINLFIKNIWEKCNATTRKKQLNLINITRAFSTSINVNEHRLIAMIDSSATKNFMSQNFIERMNFSTRKKNDAYDLMIIDENSLFNKNERVNTKTISLSLIIR